MAFITPVSTRTSFVSSTGSSSATCQRATTKFNVVKSRRNSHVVRMGLGEDGLQDDLNFAQNCIDEGCTVDAVQDVLTRLERRRAVLSLEVEKIEEIMAILAKENLGGDRSLIAEAMEAAISIFAKTNDDYPNVGSEAVNPWTLDPLKKQPKL